MEKAKKIALIAFLILVGLAAGVPAAAPTSDQVANDPDPAPDAAQNDDSAHQLAGDEGLYRYLPTWRIDLACTPF
jgi:hypothetical protein